MYIVPILLLFSSSGQLALSKGWPEHEIPYTNIDVQPIALTGHDFRRQATQTAAPSTTSTLSAHLNTNAVFQFNYTMPPRKSLMSLAENLQVGWASVAYYFWTNNNTALTAAPIPPTTVMQTITNVDSQTITAPGAVTTITNQGVTETLTNFDGRPPPPTSTHFIEEAPNYVNNQNCTFPPIQTGISQIFWCPDSYDFDLVAPAGTLYSTGKLDNDSGPWTTWTGGGCICGKGAMCCAFDAGVDVPGYYGAPAGSPGTSAALDYAVEHNCTCDGPRK